MSEASSRSPEILPEPQIEGLRRVGFIDPRILSKLQEPPLDEPAFDPANHIPVELLPVQGLLHDLAQEHPAKLISAGVRKTRYSPDMEDPFHAYFLTRFKGGHNNGLVHKDVGDTAVRLVSDSNPTLFFPSDINGEPIMNKPFQPQPGEIIEIDGNVWHMPPYQVEGRGIRTHLYMGLNS